VLGFDGFVGDLADHAKVVQRVGEVGMERAERGFLKIGCLAKKPFR
jgi:hypothetical protein